MVFGLFPCRRPPNCSLERGDGHNHSPLVFCVFLTGVAWLGENVLFVSYLYLIPTGDVYVDVDEHMATKHGKRLR